MFSISLLKVLLRSSTLLSSPWSIFMTITLNSLSGILLVCILFSNLLWFWPVHLFGVYSSVSSFCFFCVRFYVSVKSAASPPLETVGLMKKKACSVPCSSEPGSLNYLLCVLHMPYFCGWVTFSLLPSLHSSAMTLFTYCGQDLVPVQLSVGQSGTALGFKWVRQDICQRCSSTWTAGHFHGAPWEALVGGLGLQSDLMSVPNPLLGSQLDWWMWLSSPLSRAEVILEWCWPLSELSLHCQTCDTALGGLPPRVYWRVRSEEELGSAACSASKDHIDLLWEGLLSLRKLWLRPAGLEGADP